jgi:hypothetical protein
MPYGSGPLIRHAFTQATPWQRSLIAVGMVAGGVVLVLLGHVAGGLLAVTGILLLWRMLRSRFRRTPETPQKSAVDGTT